MDVIKDFAAALVQARQRKNATQEDVAWALSLSQATYNAWECGHRLCPYKHITSLINYFNDDVFTRKMLRILFSLQHQLSGLGGSPKEDVEKYYAKILSLLSDECNAWLKELK